MSLGARPVRSDESDHSKAPDSGHDEQTANYGNSVLDKPYLPSSKRLGGRMQETAGQFRKYAKIASGVFTWGVCPVAVAIAIFYATHPPHPQEVMTRTTISQAQPHP